MHRSILGATFALTAGLACATPSTCPKPGAPVLERFLSADCPDCWSAPAQVGAPADGWLFDWITPTSGEAPLSAAAPVEARERALRVGGPSPVAQQMLALRATLPALKGPTLSVQSGPAWSGYFGLQLDARGRWPAGSSGWLALVELLPAGGDGTAVARELVRTVAGPLPLNDARKNKHLRALRWPESAKPERLQARGWIEGPDGRLLAVAADRCEQR